MTIPKSAVSLLVAGAAFVIFSSSTSAQQTKTRINGKLAKEASITLGQARAAASAAAAGTIEEEELEKEHGKLVYSFDIRNAKGTITEVQVDAKTGRVVSTEEESKADEDKEKREDQKKRRNTKPNGKG